MTAVTYIKQYLTQIPPGEAFPAAALRQFASTDNIRQVLSRLVKAGELKRAARGVFIKPKPSLKMGEALPSASEVAEILTKSSGEIITIHGAEAARQLQLSTQVPLRPIFYTSGNSRKLKIFGRTIQLRHANPSRFIAAGTTPGLVIIALNYLGPESVTIETIEHIRNKISKKEFEETLRLMNRMPGWMSDIFHNYKKERLNEK